MLWLARQANYTYDVAHPAVTCGQTSSQGDAESRPQHKDQETSAAGRGLPDTHLVTA